MRTQRNDKAAVAYLRVSTQEQAREGAGLNAQEDKIRAYSTLAGLELVELIREEGVSGTVPLAERPEGARLVAMVNGRRVRHVVALKLDRLWRSAADALVTTKAWDASGVGLHLVDLGGSAVDTSSAMGRVFLTMIAGFAELERNMIAERTSAALCAKRARGEVYSGIAPFGFKRSGDRLEVEPREAAIVDRIKAEREAGLAYEGIAGGLNKAGLLPRSGGRWDRSLVYRIAKRPAVGAMAASGV